jgi:Na+-driven multidrug efflux pump
VALPAALAAAPLMRLMNAPPEVLPLATTLLVALAPVLVLDAWCASLTTVLRSHLRARDTLAVMTAMQGLQLLLMGPLMLGWGPWPDDWALGLPGFALAVLLSRLLAIGLLLALWRARLGLVPQPADGWRWRAPELRAVARIGLPGAAENIAWRLAFMVSIAVTAQLGSAALAAHAYAYQVIHFILLGGLAVGLSMEILIGHLIGAGQLRAADRLLRRGMALGFACSCLCAGAAAAAGPWLMAQFTRDAAIAAQAATLLLLTVLLEPGRAFNLIVINALRAAGDARYPVDVGAVSMAVVLAGGSWLLGLHWGWGLTGVWLAYIADEWLRGLLMWQRWRTLAWLPAARATRQRLRALRPA